MLACSTADCLDKAQEAFKLALEEKAHEAVDDVKGVSCGWLCSGLSSRGDFCALRSLRLWIFTSGWSHYGYPGA